MSILSFNGGGPQTFSFTDSNYGDNSGSLTFEIYYLGNMLVHGLNGFYRYNISASGGQYIFRNCRLRWMWSTDDVTIIVDTPITPIFTQVAPICINTSAPTLPTTSDNGVTGTWSPSTINTSTAGTSTYTFTPDAGLCATTTTMDITIDPAIQSTFAQLGAYCVGDTPDVLLGTSIEGITGTWSPAVISTASSGTSTYTFTIDAGQCALGTTMDVDITAPTTPTFTQVGPICINTSAPTLPTTSDNGVTGTWSPSTINTSTAGTSTYTFTPDAGLCATTTTMDIEIISLPTVDAGRSRDKLCCQCKRCTNWFSSCSRKYIIGHLLRFVRR